MVFVYVVYFLLLLYVLKQTHLIILQGTSRKMLILKKIVQFQQFLFQGVLFTSNSLNKLLWFFFETAMYGPIMFCCMNTVTDYFQEKMNALLLTGSIWVGLMFMSLWTHSDHSKKVFPWALHVCCVAFILYSNNFPFVGHSFIFYGACMLFLFHAMIFLWNHYDYFHLVQNGVFHPFILNQPNQNVVIQVQDQIPLVRRIVDENIFFENNVEFRRRRNNLDLIETEPVE
jgi:hypothetical protein